MTQQRDREDGGPAFTLVFAGDMRGFKGNPLKTLTPFGVPYSIGLGDAHARCDFMHETLQRVATILAEIGKNDDEIWGVYSQVIRALDLERIDAVALSKARTKEGK